MQFCIVKNKETIFPKQLLHREQFCIVKSEGNGLFPKQLLHKEDFCIVKSFSHTATIAVKTNYFFLLHNAKLGLFFFIVIGWNLAFGMG